MVWSKQAECNDSKTSEDDNEEETDFNWDEDIRFHQFGPAANFTL